MKFDIRDGNIIKSYTVDPYAISAVTAKLVQSDPDDLDKAEIVDTLFLDGSKTINVWHDSVKAHTDFMDMIMTQRRDFKMLSWSHENGTRQAICTVPYTVDAVTSYTDEQGHGHIEVSFQGSGADDFVIQDAQTAGTDEKTRKTLFERVIENIELTMMVRM